MKTIGLLGSMSWESTHGYYQKINEGIKHTLGGLHSSNIAMYSVDFDPIEKLQHQGDWEGTANILIDVAQKVELSGADFLLICTNTMYKVAPQIEHAINISVLHIADATAESLVEQGIGNVGLLVTAFTMEQGFYEGRLRKKHGLNVYTPNEDDKKIIHDVIYQELCMGKVKAESKEEYLRIIDALAKQGAKAVIPGYTEISMLVKQSDTSVILLETTEIHTDKAVTYVINN
jgi:aspartate racemase